MPFHELCMYFWTLRSGHGVFSEVHILSRHIFLYLLDKNNILHILVLPEKGQQTYDLIKHCIKVPNKMVVTLTGLYDL